MDSCGFLNPMYKLHPLCSLTAFSCLPFRPTMYMIGCAPPKGEWAHRRILAVWVGNLKVLGHRVGRASAESFLDPMVSLPSWRWEKGGCGQGDPELGPGQGASPPVLRTKLDPGAPVHKRENGENRCCDFVKVTQLVRWLHKEFLIPSTLCKFGLMRLGCSICGFI